MHVETNILMNVVSIHLDEVTVRLGQDNPFKVYSLLRVDFLVSWVVQPCAWR